MVYKTYTQYNRFLHIQPVLQYKYRTAISQGAHLYTSILLWSRCLLQSHKIIKYYSFTFFISQNLNKKCKFPSKRIEFILEGNLLEKSVKPWIVKRPFCCTVSILQVYFTYLCYITFGALKYHFIENRKFMFKENQIMK